ncbi:MAG: DHH family phosphoesterase [Myxococcota bacterium]
MLQALLGQGRVLLTGPTGPDGDSIGACLALQRVLRARGVDASVAGTAPPRFAWLPGAGEMLSDEALAERPPEEAVVILDGDRHRLTPEVDRRFAAAPVRAIIDHHRSTTVDGYTVAWLAPEAESTCGMLLRALRGWDVPLDAEMATLLYTGLVFDTGGFRHSNTQPDTHLLAAELLSTGIDHAQITVRTLCERSPQALAAMGRILAGAEQRPATGLCLGRVPLALQRELRLAEGDLEGVVDALVNTTGTRVAALLVERADGTVKYSLRSRGEVDVARVARALHPTGGGHARAAGAVVDGPIARAEHQLEQILVGSEVNPS